MNIICPICTECVLPNEDLCANSCGHIFHYPCIRQWIERSQTCPQCRKQCTEKYLNRIFFTVAAGECTEQDVANLERKLEILNQNYQEQSKKFDNLQEEAKKLRSDNKKSAKTIIALADKARSKEFALRNFQTEMKKIKDELLEHQGIKKELDALKNRVDLVSSIEVLLDSNHSNVQQLLAKRPSMDTLAYMVSNLKRDLIKVVSSRNDLKTTLIQTKNILKEEKQRREQLQDQLSVVESEKYELERQIRKRQRENDEDEIPEKRKPNANSSNSSVSSLEIDNSDSPYLRVQSSAVGLTPILKKPSQFNATDLPPDLKKLSIFQQFRPQVQSKNNIPSGTYVSDGMGGLEKKENFPGFPLRSKLDLNSSSVKKRLKSGALKKPSK
ncbi:E3 ubiquitin-protein ligase TRAIP [Phlebotomus argentipes]|uniref:E3 ubiquitin-protein ligase TRAIP n=1 Tax=Phlebotomus argentipes TaxID=94469 RepID=UPI0028930505|nr:E3 ubiquitin-protein ligase TRAIP [Phlebotomus argentipes]